MVKRSSLRWLFLCLSKADHLIPVDCCHFKTCFYENNEATKTKPKMLAHKSGKVASQGGHVYEMQLEFGV